MEASELDLVLAQAGAIAKKHQIRRQEALLLMIAHELICIHFHVDKVLTGEIKHGVDGARSKQQ